MIHSITFPIHELGEKCGEFSIKCNDGIFYTVELFPNNMGIGEDLNVGVRFKGEMLETEPHASVINFAEVKIENSTIQMYVDNDEDTLVVEFW